MKQCGYAQTMFDDIILVLNYCNVKKGSDVRLVFLGCYVSLWDYLHTGTMCG